MITQLLIAAALSISLFAPAPESAEWPRRSELLLQTLRTDSNHTLIVEWNPATQTPSSLSGQLTKPSLHSPGWIAYEYLDKIKALYGLKRVKEQLAIVRIDETEQGYNVLMQRLLFKKPVCGEPLIVTINASGVIQRIEGTMHLQLEKKRLGRPMPPVYSQQEAKQIALAADPSIASSSALRIESCYLPDRDGVPLVHQVFFEKNGRTAAMTIHALTGKVIR